MTDKKKVKNGKWNTEHSIGSDLVNHILRLF